MESEQFSLSLPPMPGRHRVNSLVKFSPSCLAPSPKAQEVISFRMEDILFTAASDSEDFGAASLDALLPRGQEARPSPAYTELVDVLASATEKLSLDWPDEPRESQSSKLDERFLSGSGSPLPFFPDMHHEISRSWKQPTGYGAVPVIEDTLAAHLSPTSAPSWKSRPLLPSKPCRTVSTLIGKFYMAAGQAGAALHTMVILQAYQVELLETSRGAQAISPLRRPLKVGDTPGFLVTPGTRGKGNPASVSPALAFTASSDHASTHENAGDVQSEDPVLVSPLKCSTLLPLLAFHHALRDLPFSAPS
ncbi:hypothetical protein G5714_018557 [Onychostoma macrolepis]|uniref:Uncharacterized protein n=1 Tax=Onychostoma macrolepis TaxID=369639 RepID=A0A7J6BZY8_9TELE|nr:hypothetical protein G5714_018557 [Onychostoma macrolepis]